MAKRILVVDDEQDIVKMVGMRLQASGYEVLTASNGEEGLQKAKQYKPDLAILDIIMPKMDGNSMAEAMMQDSNTRDIPIIFLTCLVEKSETGMEENVIGGHFFLAKPFDSKELLAMIAKIFKE